MKISYLINKTAFLIFDSIGVHLIPEKEIQKTVLTLSESKII